MDDSMAISHAERLARLISKFLIAGILLATVLIGYIPIPEYIKELTCISNFSIGLMFLVAGVRQLLGRDEFPNWVYSCGLVTIMLVFLICMFSLTGLYHMNFKGVFLFLHAINPLLVLAYYLVFVDEKHLGNARSILFTPCIALVYLLVDYIVGEIAGKFVYGFFEPANLSIFLALLVGLGVYALLVAVGYALYFINRRIRK